MQTPDACVLVDAGVGSVGTVASEAFSVVGDLTAQLADLGYATEDVDAVVFTHSHEDHLGWASDPLTGHLTFPRARHLIAAREWDVVQPPNDTPDWVTQSLGPLVRAGRLEPVRDGPLLPGVELVALPGHTPGHSGVVVSGARGTVALVGDAFNHPLQIAEPSVPSLADGDPELAVATRKEIISRALGGSWPLLGSAHHPGAFWSVELDGDACRWRSRAADVQNGGAFS